jgi:hypothetical protein
MAPEISYWERDGLAFEYPPELCMRNTFIDGKQPRSPSLDEFFVERRVRSCPSSGVEKIGGIDEDETDVSESFGASSDDLGDDAVRTTSGITFHSQCSSTTKATESTSAGSSEGPSAAEEELEDPGELLDSVFSVDGYLDSAPEQPPQASKATLPTVLSLRTLLHGGAEEEYDLNMNKGSAFHATGRCKPCAFFHNKGCESGADCEFCHICPVNEKKCRKKERAEARRWQKALGASCLSGSPACVLWMPGAMAVTPGALPYGVEPSPQCTLHEDFAALTCA